MAIAYSRAQPVMPEAVAALIPDGATVAVTGSGGGLLEPDYVFEAIERSFLETGHPRDLTLIHALGYGNPEGSGIGRFAHRGLVKCVIGGHWASSHAMQALARNNEIEAYCLPTGVMTGLLRETGAGRIGLISEIGLGTFVDPVFDGGRCNEVSKRELVSRMEIEGKTYLRYRPFRIDIGIIRGTLADENGNVSLIDEPADLEVYALALATRNTGGKILAQVRDVVANGSLKPREVAVPGVLVDWILPHRGQHQSYMGYHLPSLSGTVRQFDEPRQPPLAPIRRVIARRAARELREGQRANFGVGVSADVSSVLTRRQRELNWLTIEQGIHNGYALADDMFGTAINPEAIIDMPSQFDYFTGGALDIAFLGFAQIDRAGNVNVSHIDGNLIGPGGFIDISQSAKTVVFCGTFEAKGAAYEIGEGKLTITRHGAVQKLVPEVDRITFSAARARELGQTVLYVTERAVFRLTGEGIELIEVAPGVDKERDILARMGFRPIEGNPSEMPY